MPEIAQRRRRRGRRRTRPTRSLLSGANPPKHPQLRSPCLKAEESHQNLQNLDPKPWKPYTLNPKPRISYRRLSDPEPELPTEEDLEDFLREKDQEVQRHWSHFTNDDDIMISRGIDRWDSQGLGY